MTRSFNVNGKTLTNVKLPTAFAPTIDDVRKGYTIANTGQHALWRTVVIRGAPTSAPSAMEFGYTIKKAYLTLDGKPVNPSRLRQNDRLIVSIEGKAMTVRSTRPFLSICCRRAGKLKGL